MIAHGHFGREGVDILRAQQARHLAADISVLVIVEGDARFLQGNHRGLTGVDHLLQRTVGVYCQFLVIVRRRPHFARATNIEAYNLEHPDVPLLEDSPHYIIGPRQKKRAITSQFS